MAKLGKYGETGFYRGTIATNLVRSVNSNGGIWTQTDLERYQVIERLPTYIHYRNAKITTTSLPSAGGLTLAQALNILEQFNLKNKGEIEQAHLIIEAMRRAFEDRTNCFGDSDFVTVDVNKFRSETYARKSAATINLSKASQSKSKDNISSCNNDALIQSRLDSLTPENYQYLELAREGENTSHFSIMDSEGNRVATTLSINTFFGSGLVAGDTGILLNNEMDDFSTALNVSNIYGLRGSLANGIKPGKRPLSSMSPTFIENNHEVLIGGTPGGSRIITSILLLIIGFVDQQNNKISTLIKNPRYHHQYLPDEVFIERDGFNEEWVNTLKEVDNLQQ